MSTSVSDAHTSFDELKPGDRIEVEHAVTVGRNVWPTRTYGKVLRTERGRQGLHYRRNFDDSVFCDTILMELPDGELTAITIDEGTHLRRA